MSQKVSHPNLTPEWKHALDLARGYFNPHDVSDDQLMKIAAASLSVDHFNIIIKDCYRSSQGHPDRGRPFKTLFSYCDESIYSLTDWLRAYDHFRSYLSESGRSEDFQLMLGYLQCCSLSPENKDIKHDFVDLLQSMLDQFGFKGKTK